MTKPHKHSEQIKAWANGAVIQYWSVLNESWMDSENNEPKWYEHVIYRVKAVPKPAIVSYNGFYQSDDYPELFTADRPTYSDPHLVAKSFQNGWTCVAIIKTTVDGDTFKVKSVEHISV